MQPTTTTSVLLYSEYDECILMNESKVLLFSYMTAFCTSCNIQKCVL
jgi:hypothetical protein